MKHSKVVLKSKNVLNTSQSEHSQPGAMKSITALFVLSCCLAAACGRQLHQAPKITTVSTASYPTLAEAVTAAQGPGTNLSILMAAVQASGVASALGPNTAWTILAPTDAAFTERLQEDLNLTPQQLLEPANNETLLKVLSYHVIPSAAVLSTQLQDGDTVTTALAGAAPLVIDVNDNGRVEIRGATNNADVTIADIKAGQSVIHVIDDVLLPAGIGKPRAAESGSG